MDRIGLAGIEKRFAPALPLVLKGIDLEVAPGELLVLLGPSGCGKTTLLRCIAGLESPTAGRVTFGDQVVFSAPKTDLAPEKRNLGMVFQQYALWPHMRVRDIIAYPLRKRGHARKRTGEKVADVARLVECSDLLERYPSELSGGQQQRIALARALVAEPASVLFDEPLSNLDAKLRHDLRIELRQLHSRAGFTGIYVTHDQAEAFAIADRVAVMREGEIVQIDAPERVWSAPATEWVADFVGATNVVSTHESLQWCDGADGSAAWLRSAADGGAVRLRVRPQDPRLVPRGQPDRPGSAGTDASDALRLHGSVVETVVYGGAVRDCVVRWPDGQRWVVQQRTHVGEGRSGGIQEGMAVDILLRPADVLLFGDDQRLRPGPGQPAAAGHGAPHPENSPQSAGDTRRENTT